MWEALEANTPFVIHPGEWHVPYVNRMRGTSGLMYLTEVYIADDVYETQFLTAEEALAVSSSCCAQVSYRTLDMSLSKAQTIYGRLVDSEPVHASPFEHQATPMKYATGVSKTLSYINMPPAEWTQAEVEWQDGVTHLDLNDKFWSGNFCGYIQHRQLIPNNVRKG
ncbi:hypothetical protein D3C81_1800980 [compost metagenome]